MAKKPKRKPALDAALNAVERLLASSKDLDEQTNHAFWSMQEKLGPVPLNELGKHYTPENIRAAREQANEQVKENCDLADKVLRWAAGELFRR